MPRSASLPAQLVITALLATVVAFAIPVFVDRQEYTRAVTNYVKNPSPENDALLRVEGAKSRRISFTTHLEASGVLFILMNAGWFLVCRWPRKSIKGG